MFKKPVEVRNQQRLSGADRKKLRRTMRECFPAASDADLDLILPPKGDVLVDKLVNKALVYKLEGGPPMLFDANGRGREIFPTVYALWKVPGLVPSFTLKGAEVSRYVLGGADLMLPGISVPPEGLPPFREDEVWAVRVPDNVHPIAVGATLVSSEAALRNGLRGKGLHGAEGRCVPNAGFLDDIVTADPDPPPPPPPPFPPSEAAASGEGSPSDHDPSVPGTLKSPWGERAPGPPEEGRAASRAEGAAGSGAAASESFSADQGQAGAGTGRSLHTEQELQGEEQEEQERLLGAGVAGLGVGADRVSGAAGEAAAAAAAAAPPMTAEETDALLDRCLLQALRSTLKDKDLPIPSSTLWSNHVLPCRPPGSVVDIKKSSHKKLSKWLTAKANEGWMAAKEDKHRKEVIVTAVNRRHPAYLAFIPEAKPSPPPEVSSSTVAAGTAAAAVAPATAGGAASSADGSGSGGAEVEVVEVYKATHHVAAVLEAVGGADAAAGGRFYTAQEAADVAATYVERAGLAKSTDGAVVVLDAVLCDALFKGAVKKGAAYPTEVHRRDLGPAFVRRMQAHHRVTRGGQVAVKKGALQKVQVLTERRQGNKKVTRVSGVESFLVAPDALAAELQKKFACSTTVGEIPGKKDHEVLVQGGVLEDLARHLVSHYGIPKKYIEVLDKTKRN
eukprot:jgi/Mesen1/668/ME000109S10887